MGRRNVGKSTLINCLTNEEVSSANETSQTITDLLSRRNKLLPRKIFVTVDIPTIDFKDEPGNRKKDRTNNVLFKSDLIILVLDARIELDVKETELITYLQKKKLPFVAVVNKIEMGTNAALLTELEALEINYFEVSCTECAGIEALKRELFHHLKNLKNSE